jgi:short-subunit dehydrogenase
MRLTDFYYFYKRQTKTNFKPVILVTGCASGIGWALAKLLHKITRYRVVVTAREKSLYKLKESFCDDDRFMILPLDITSDESRRSTIKTIEERWGPVNVLISNAGISYRAVVEHMSSREEIKQMDTNYLGPMELIRLVLPGMREKGRGKIIAVSSVSGMLSMPTMSAYSASKHALEGALESLWYEARPFGIDIALIQPGFIRSSSFKHVYYTELSDPKLALNGDYKDFYLNMTPFVEKLMSMSPTNPKKVAQKIISVIRRESPPLWVPATWDALIFYYLRRLMPRRYLLQFLYLCLPKASSWAQDVTHRRKD